MLARAGIIIVLVAGLLGLAPTGASAAAQDAASTQAYLSAASVDLQAAIASMSTIDADVTALNRRYAGECPDVDAGSTQDEAADPMTYEVAGALWSTGYHTDARIVDAFVRAVGHLRWSNPAIAPRVRAYAASLHDLAVLPLPDVCADMRAWAASDYEAVPAASTQFDRRLDAIDGHPPALSLLAPYEGSAQRALAARVAHLEARFEELEGELSQKWFDETLQTLALPQ